MANISMKQDMVRAEALLKKGHYRQARSMYANLLKAYQADGEACALIQQELDRFVPDAMVWKIGSVAVGLYLLAWVWVW